MNVLNFIEEINLSSEALAQEDERNQRNQINQINQIDEPNDYYVTPRSST